MRKVCFVCMRVLLLLSGGDRKLEEEGCFCSALDHCAEKLPEVENCVLSFLFFIKVNIIISRL